jgi:diguanylate cyclase (GGDEF)-like protein/PAS domain S-box-containing protein
MYEQFRKNEGMILLCQNNEDQTLLIYGINPRAHEITGFDPEEIRGRSLMEIVPKPIRETIRDYVEFSQNGTDIAAVLRKMREFQLLNAEGDAVPLEIKVAQAEARDAHFWYRLILKDQDYEQNLKQFHQAVAAAYKGHEVLDEDTGLPDRLSFVDDMDVVRRYAGESGVSCCIALFRVDRYDEFLRYYGKAAAILALGQTGETLRRNLRADDKIARVEADTLGVILLDISRESARVVLNRLRWAAASEPIRIPDMISTPKVTVSVAFSMLRPEHPASALEACERDLARHAGENGFLEST